MEYRGGITVARNVEMETETKESKDSHVTGSMFYPDPDDSGGSTVGPKGKP
jgi:hypothetical protein